MSTQKRGSPVSSREALFHVSLWSGTRDRRPLTVPDQKSESILGRGPYNLCSNFCSRTVCRRRPVKHGLRTGTRVEDSDYMTTHRLQYNCDDDMKANGKLMKRYNYILKKAR